MYDQYARRAALDSSPDDDQHELLTSERFLVHNRTYSVVNFEDEQQQQGPE